jgi:hypothetical protein
MDFSNSYSNCCVPSLKDYLVSSFMNILLIHLITLYFNFQIFHWNGEVFPDFTLKQEDDPGLIFLLVWSGFDRFVWFESYAIC